MLNNITFLGIEQACASLFHKASTEVRTKLSLEPMTRQVYQFFQRCNPIDRNRFVPFPFGQRFHVKPQETAIQHFFIVSHQLDYPSVAISQ